MNSKAQTSPVFKYIFAAVAGVIVLIFFITFGAQYIGLQETKSSSEIATSLNHVLDALLTVEGTNAPIDTPFERDLYITCNRISFKGGYPTDLEKIVFAPTILEETSKLHVWTIGWRFPFKVTNLFYISSPNTYFYLVHDSSTKQQVEKLTSSSFTNYIPTLYKRQAIGINQLDTSLLTQIKNQAKNARIKFAFFTTPSNAQQIKRELPNSEIVYLNVNSEWEGEVTFYDTGDKVMLLGLPFVYGAIFSDSAYNFNCSISKALDHLKFMVGLYTEKAKYIRIKERGNCNYQLIIENLVEFSSRNTATSLIEQRAKLEDVNDLLIKNGCISIF